MRRYRSIKFIAMSVVMLVLSSFAAGAFSGMETRIEAGIYYASVCMVILSAIGTIASAIYMAFESEKR